MSGGWYQQQRIGILRQACWRTPTQAKHKPEGVSCEGLCMAVVVATGVAPYTSVPMMSALTTGSVSSARKKLRELSCLEHLQMQCNSVLRTMEAYTGYERLRHI